ncbi:MAG: hypothetical protein HZA93_24855 [Verrucomicrobia bacterium]|nr:hypothetical protein [Verrucomicrobiota bacterium]
MSVATEKLAKLRRQLAERFPSAPRISGRTLPTGLATIDHPTGGLPLGAVTEFVCAAPSCGGQLLIGQLLAATRAQRIRAALVDAADAFDPSSSPPDLLVHLVWVRCTPATALSAADLLARDANLGLVILDLRRGAEAELRRTPSTTWYRLQRAVEPADLALVVLTPQPAVPSAQLRFMLSRSHPAAALTTERPALATALSPALQRQRLQVALAG